MNSNYYAVIMAGGVGSRFWPVSTKENPKQFHDMLGVGVSLLQQTYQRLSGLIPTENIFIATNQEYKSLVKSHLPDIDESRLVLEPAMRNTAPCILYTALKINQINKNALMLVAPSDHWIDDEPEFIRNVESSFKACEKNDLLMTLGIKPSSPNTGYGYIQFEASSNPVKKVKNFTEKPDLLTARKFLEQGDYLWNAGIFIWSSKSILLAFTKFLPDMTNLFRQGDTYWNTPKEIEFIAKNYAIAENVSIDYGIMEKAGNVYVLPVDFGWNDLGTWGALFDKLTKDNNNNAVVNALTFCEGANNNMISSLKGKKIVVRGLSDFIIVDTADTLLILPKTEEQEIKHISAQVIRGST
ncbi:MAG: mannose-1-phosphate guanylyltransferase [Flavobacteriaceae bacterium]|nr:mannose-1-phosphate guanylyltransferase [Flavobacteriaceae bacterium]